PDSGLGVDIPGVVAVGAITNTTGNAFHLATTSSSIASVDLGGGMVTAGAVSATASMKFKAGAFLPSGDSSLASLVVNGTAMSANQPPNTTVAIPGVGTLIINEQIQ